MGKRVAIITGASGGIGTAMCHAFKDAGHDVIGIDIGPPPSSVSGIKWVSLDLEAFCSGGPYRASALARLVDVIATRSVSALVNCAALQIVKPIDELTVDDWSRTFHVNVLAPFLLTQALSAELKTAAGAVINISSIHANRTKSEFTAYATSKAALNGLTRSLALELAPEVRVNAISPAAINTRMLAEGFTGREQALRALGQMHPVGRIGESAEVAALAVFLASDAARFISGAEYALDGAIGCRLPDPT
jgi:NAD(P)-dependent dehydrogenase (short-subunit alcohol dehydrogenase family)